MYACVLAYVLRQLVRFAIYRNTIKLKCGISKWQYGNLSASCAAKYLHIFTHRGAMDEFMQVFTQGKAFVFKSICICLGSCVKNVVNVRRKCLLFRADTAYEQYLFAFVWENQ